MSDIATNWATTRGDWALAGPDLASGNELVTAVLISLFTDRVANRDDSIPDATRRLKDPRGWWGDGEGGPIGSRLWLISRAKQTQQTLGLAQGYIVEALKWMADDGLVSKIDVSVEWTRSSTLGAQITLYSPRTGRQLVKVGTQNVFRLPDVQAWGWSAGQGAGQWASIAPTVPTVVDTGPSKIQLLLHGDGIDGGSVITDSSTAHRVASIVGAVTTSTAGTHLGSAALLFDGASRISYPQDTRLDLGASDFTIEFRVNFASIDSQSAPTAILSKWRGTGAGQHSYRVIMFSDGNGTQIRFYYTQGGVETDVAFDIALVLPLMLGTTYSLALVRIGSEMHGYINGLALPRSGASPIGAIDSIVAFTTVGGNVINGSTFEAIDGTLEELRLTIGAATHTGPYTPATTPFPDA